MKDTLSLEPKMEFSTYSQDIFYIIKDQQAVATTPSVNTLAPLVKRIRSVSKIELQRHSKSSAYKSIRQE